MPENVQKLLQDNVPGIDLITAEWGATSLREYAAGFFTTAPATVQSRDDLLDVVRDYAGRLLGPELAAKLVAQLEESPTVLTANHHGVDYRALTVQGTLIFALGMLLASGTAEPGVVPVLACGTIPLSNYTFPLGISLSRQRKAHGDNGSSPQVRVNLFPWKMSESLVSVTRAYEDRDLVRARRAVRKLGQEGELSPAELHVLERLLDEDYGCGAALCQRDYSDQSVVINNRVWKKLFALPLRQGAPELAYLEMERISTILLAKDLRDPDSLLHNVLFDTSLRALVLESADRVTGCWDRGRLEYLLADESAKHRSEEFRGSGSMFFWGVGSRGQRVPMALEDMNGSIKLHGISSSEPFSVKLEPETIAGQLESGRLVPSLFTSFSVLALARGVKCYGGFYQADYLPAMRDGLARAVERWGNPGWAELISGVRARNFVTGMNVVLADYDNDFTTTAGAVEMMAAGGLTAGHLDKIGALTVDEANRCGLLEAYGHLLREISNSEAEKEEHRKRLLGELGARMARISLQH